LPLTLGVARAGPAAAASSNAIGSIGIVIIISSRADETGIGRSPSAVYACSDMTEASVSSIAHIIQLAVAPVFLLAGIGSLLNVLAGRISRIVDRARQLERHVPTAEEDERIVEIRELEILDRRMTYIHWAIGLCVAAALQICLVVVILFVADLIDIRFAIPVSLLFIAAMISLTLGLLLFLAEVTLATRFVRVNEKFVTRSRRRMR